MPPPIATAAPLLESAPTLWRHGGDDPRVPSIDDAVALLDDGPLAAEQRPALIHDDRCLYIYTSGTTGLPKAANINHYRVIAAMVAFSAVMGATANDRMYDCLPLYHTVGGVCRARRVPRSAAGRCSSREKFSASQFWDDVVDHGCTLFQYIGELCRYLVNAPPHPKERLHHIRLCCGNGLRPGHLAGIQAALRHPAYPRVLCRHRRQRGPVQFRRHARRHRPLPGLVALRCSR